MQTLDNQATLRIAVIVASTGRPSSIAHLLKRLEAQSHPPTEVVLSVVTATDLPTPLPQTLRGQDGTAIPLTIVTGPKGLPAQRNTGLRNVRQPSDLLAFFDDDYLPSRHCLSGMSSVFLMHANVVGATGHLLADGINSAGISTETAESMLAAFDSQYSPSQEIVKDLHGLYGCNMVFRTISTAGIQFDERLKLYGWQEDIDFSNQVSRRGRLIKTKAFAGIHQGVKGGRTSGVKLGYSQVVNPAYLVKKGTMSAAYARKIVIRNVAANHLKVLRPEPWVDRLGRARGNWIGIIDVLFGKLTPERIERL